MEKRKPTFRMIRDWHRFSISELKGRTDLPEVEIYRMLSGIPVTQEMATRILTRLSQMTEIRYTLENVEVVLHNDQTINEQDEAAMLPLPTFQRVRREQHITLHMLIEDTQLDPEEVLSIDRHGIGTEQGITALLEALSRLTGVDYTRENVGGFYITACVERRSGVAGEGGG